MKKIGTFVLNNLDTLLAIAISVVAAILGVFGGSQSFLLSAMAGVLGLLAYGLIRDRIAREDLLKQVQQLKSKPRVGDIFKDRNAYTPLNVKIASAQYICFVGPSLTSIFSELAEYFCSKKLGEHEAIIHAIILDPDCSAIESTAKCLNEPVENLRKDINYTISRVQSMQQGEYGIMKKGAIELRQMQANPNYSMVLTDPDKPNGKMSIEFIGYHTRFHDRPHIDLTRQHDREWFEYFLSQYHALWQHSQIVVVKHKSEIDWSIKAVELGQRPL